MEFSFIRELPEDINKKQATIKVVPNGFWNTSEDFHFRSELIDNSEVGQDVMAIQESFEQMVASLGDARAHSANSSVHTSRRFGRTRRNQMSRDRNIRMYTGTAGMEAFDTAMRQQIDSEMERARAQMSEINVLPQDMTDTSTEELIEALRSAPMQLLDSSRPERVPGVTPNIHMRDEVGTSWTPEMIESLTPTLEENVERTWHENMARNYADISGHYIGGIDAVVPIEEQGLIPIVNYYNYLPKLEGEDDLTYLDRLSSQV